MSRERMSDYVRRNSVENSGLLAITGQEFPKGLAQHRAAAIADKEVRAGAALEQSCPAVIQIFFHRLQRRFAHRHDALLVAFAEHADIAEIPLHVRDPDAAQLGNPEAGSVEKFEHRAVAQALWFSGVGRSD